LPHRPENQQRDGSEQERYGQAIHRSCAVPTTGLGGAVNLRSSRRRLLSMKLSFLVWHELGKLFSTVEFLLFRIV